MNNTLGVGALFAALMQASMCSPQSPGIPTDPEVPQGPTTEAEFINTAVGRYAHYDVVAYLEDAPFVGEFRTLIITYGFTDLEEIDGQLIATDRYCETRQKANQPFTTRIPDEMSRAIIPDSTPVEIWNEAGIWHLFRPETPEVVGFDIPNDQSLPEDPNDPRVTDPDNDGHPGLTVHLTLYNFIEAELYIARREIFAYEVELKPNGNLEGTVFDRSEQRVLGSSIPWLLDRPAEPLQYEDLSQSPIYLVPVDDDYDCDRLMAERDILFPEEQEVW